MERKAGEIMYSKAHWSKLSQKSNQHEKTYSHSQSTFTESDYRKTFLEFIFLFSIQQQRNVPT